LQAGQKVCLVSPDTALVAEVMVLPKDIGWLSVGNKVHLQIDAFNYTDWGMVSGKILEISNDFQLTNQTPVFKVRCTLDKQVLTLNNGIKGILKKGMTLNARFFVAERSLMQLITDKANNWLNPAQHRKQL
jgi:HlyD family secretion protein